MEWKSKTAIVATVVAVGLASFGANLSPLIKEADTNA